MGAACGQSSVPHQPGDRPAAATSVASRPRAAHEARRSAGQAASRVIMQNSGGVDEAYDLQQQIGEGSFGSVCMATHRLTGVVRAMKTVRKGSPTQVQALRKEISVMASMDHPNIIQLFETFEDRQCIHFAMELASGGELFDHIVKARQFSERRAAIIMRQILRAVNYMHDSGVAHRDIKPENFLFATKAPLENNTLKLIDFGLACPCRTGHMLKSKVGTQIYMAPQVMMGRYDKMCDMWSVGVVMYVLLCGRPPITGSSDRETAMKVRDGRWSFEGEFWQQVSAQAKALVSALMRRNAQARMNASDALAHAWVQQTAPRARARLSTKLVERLRGFEAQNRMKRVVLEIVARELNDGKIRELREAFEALDADNDGKLCMSELASGLEQSGLSSMLPDAKAILGRVDFDRSGAIDYTEFLAATLDRKADLTDNVLWTAFNVFDQNGDGKITASELHRVLKTAQLSCAEELMKPVDANGDGSIDFQEFVAMMRKSNADRRDALFSLVPGSQGGA
mmetsp:Transcript_20264/g.58756  ORF Transcript_20264/g.58756 Transcript_20264/m.58756 type:complete len:512 (-) Transcript_20264:294-1829(-)